MAASPRPHRRLLITAGPTHEPIDAVRYLGNRSSGRMGLALATVAAARGWSVTLLLGPTALPTPVDSQVTTRRFRTTADLQDRLRETWPAHDVLIMAAAVADFRPVRVDPEGKMARRPGRVSLELEPTPDLLAGIAREARPNQLVVGFALDPSGRLDASARRKLHDKGLDAIVANPLETMDATAVTGTLLLRDGRTIAAPPELPKDEFASWLLEHIEAILAAAAATS